MFKRFLMGVVIFFLASNVTASVTVLINSDVENVITDISRVSSQNNLIRFRLGNNNEVQRALVSFPATSFDYDSFNTSMQSSFMYCAIWVMTGSQN